MEPASTPVTETDITDEPYEVEVVDADAKPADRGAAETENIEQEGDPIGDNFA